MKVSVIVPTHERQLLLSEALRSVQNQTHTDFECIVVDDASDSLIELPFSDDRFRLVKRETNGGPAAARNSGLEVAIGDAISFLDDDDVYTPNRLATATRLLAFADISLCGAGQIGQGEVAGEPRISLETIHDSILNQTSPPLGTLTIKRHCCPTFNENYVACEDLDWLIRATENRVVARTTEIGWLWRQHHEIRVLHGTATRITGSRQLLSEHHGYFQEHKRARAFRRYRLAVMSLSIGEIKSARFESLLALRDGYLKAAITLGRSFFSNLTTGLNNRNDK